MKLFLAKLGLAFGAIAFLVLLGEGTLQVYHRIVHGMPLFASHARLGEYPLGWGGRRVWGNPQSTRPRVLVLGDSLTAGWSIPDEALYSTVLGQLLNAEIFAFGGGGYGTLQEALALDQSLTMVKPDLVLLQVTSNDFINNSWALESSSWSNTNLRVRPYLEGKEVVYRFPSCYRIMEPLLTHSRLAYTLAADSLRVGTHLARLGWLSDVEHRIEVEGLAFSGFRDAVNTTGQIIARMKTKLAPVPFVAFAADASYLDHWRVVLAGQAVPFIEDVPGRIVEEEAKRHASLRLDGAHWNAEGHRIVGEVLAHRLAAALPR